MPLYLVTIPVTVETYAVTASLAEEQARHAIGTRVAIAAPLPGVPLHGPATVYADPARNNGRTAEDAPPPPDPNAPDPVADALAEYRARAAEYAAEAVMGLAPDKLLWARDDAALALAEAVAARAGGTS